MQTLRLLQIDAFTSEPFRGNPAAVCLLDEEVPELWMQAVAAEMNLSETAFIVPRGDGSFGIRWFTPTTEVPLCGHATLASAHALWTEKRAPEDCPLTFHGRSGRLIARREEDWICLDFPALVTQTFTPPPGLAEALGCQVEHFQQNEFLRCLVLVDKEATVRGLKPDFGEMLRVGVDACAVTAASESAGCDFVSRFFAPGLGIDEDPVTGAAHCMLGPFWAERLGKDALVAHQVSRRGGVVKVRVRGDRVDLVGQATTVMEGILRVSPSHATTR